MNRVVDSFTGQEIEYEQGFFGSCMGVILRKRGEDNPSVTFIVVVEDDDTWFTSRYHSSVFWLPDLYQQLGEAQMWIEANCEKEGAYGVYRFRT